MSVDWDGFSDGMSSYFERLSAKNSVEAANIIANRYDISVRSGGEILANNFVIRGNKQLLVSALISTFNTGITVTTSPYDSMRQIGVGLVGYWTGAQLSLVYPPPGAISVVSNVVVTPGTFFSFPTLPVDNYSSWLDVFVSIGKSHLLTVVGQMIALVPTPAGPVPTPYPWFGYR